MVPPIASRIRSALAGSLTLIAQLSPTTNTPLTLLAASIQLSRCWRPAKVAISSVRSSEVEHLPFERVRELLAQ